MKLNKVDLFFSLNGIDAHIELEPVEGEKGLAEILKVTQYLKESGALPRVNQSKFGGSGKFNTKREPTETDGKCPTCSEALKEKQWTRRDGKVYRVLQCPSDEKHFKEFYPVSVS